MIDGQRVANSALSGAQAVDLNSIPLAMIESVEVLKDGASAIYGSDAIGGVINIKLKKDYNGVTISSRYGFPVEGPKDHGSQYQVSILVGSSTDTARFTAGAQIYEQKPLLTKDREIGSQSAASLATQNIGAAPAYFSPSFPGKVQSSGQIFLLASSPFAATLDGYNPTLSTPPVFTGQSFNTVAAYNSYAISHGYVDPTGHGLGPYVPAPGAGAILNTTDFGTTTVLEQDRRQFWATAEKDIFKDTLTLYSTFLYSDNSANGQLAPSPVPSLTTYNTFVPANNPFNPFGIDLGQGGAAAPRVRSRFVDFGNRTFVSLSDFFQWVGGLKGNFTPDYSYDLSYDYSQDRQEQQTRNAVNGALLNQAFIPIGATDALGRPLSTLTDASGNNLPVYNIFGSSLRPGSGVNAPETLDALRATLFTWGQSELWSAQGVFRGTPFSLPAGKVAFAIGAGYNDESIQLQVDGLSSGNLAPGLNVAVPFARSMRTTAAGYAEVNIPVTSPDMKIPGLYALEINAAGRYQTFDPGGDAAIPKVGIRWQPIDDQFMIRGSYNQGFIAPSIFTLFGPAFASNPNVIVQGQPGQVQTEVTGNPNLKASNSEQYGGGIVITPKNLVKNLTVSIDYYHVTEDHLAVSDPQSVANSLNALGSASPFAPGFTFQDGSHLTTTAPNQVTIDNWLNAAYPWEPAGALKTDGLDFSVNYVVPDETTRGFGKFSLTGTADYKLSYKYQQSPTLPFVEYKGTYTPFQGTIPEWSLNLSLAWEFHEFTFVVSANYLPEISDPGLLIGPYSQTEQGFTINNTTQPFHVPDYYTIDLQLSYEVGKGKLEGRKWYDGSKFTVGCLNATDSKPPVISDAVEDNTDKNVYDILGQFVYFEISKKF